MIAPTETPGFPVVPTLTFPLEVWQKMLSFVLACPIEVNGFGNIIRNGYDFLVEDVIILEQTATIVHVEVDETAMSQYLTQATRDGTANSIRLQWHSHVNGTARFSLTDMANIEGYKSEWMISLVTNKRGEIEARLDVFKPFRVWTPVTVVVDCPLSPEQIAFAHREVVTKVHRQGRVRGSQVKPEYGQVLVLDAERAHVTGGAA